jgi:hypothetical protein
VTVRLETVPADIQPLPRGPDIDEVLRRVGRNVVNFQCIEHLLKQLTAVSVPTGPASTMAARVEKHAATVNTSTMGILAGKLKDTVLTSPPDKAGPDDIDEIWIGIRFSMEVEAEFVDLHDREMQALVEARNDLIHHFLPRWHSATQSGTASALEYLDAQNAEAMRMLGRLRGWVQSMEEVSKQHIEVLASPEGERQLELAFLRGSRLVGLLGEIAVRTARIDGWAYLTTAHHLIRREAPDELDDLEKRFGLPNLRAILLATEFFDIADEELPKGGKRVIYRLNDRYELTLPHDQDAQSAKKIKT